MGPRPPTIMLLVLQIPLVACTGPQSTLDPQGPVAASIATLWWVMFWSGLVILLLVYGTDVGRRITQASDDALVIHVTGHQWWWEVRYPATNDSPEVRTANELRLPVGVPVQFVIESADVVHSFWIPSLAGRPWRDAETRPSRADDAPLEDADVERIARFLERLQ